MNGEQDLINKLMVSKKMMDIHNRIPRGGVQGNIPQSEGVTTPMVETHQPVNATYNIPEGVDMGSMGTPQTQIQQPQEITEDRIMSSKLPDEIKRLMLENPIEQPSMGAGPTLSNDLVEKASRLMGTNKQQPIQEQTRQAQPQTQIPSNFREMLKEVVTEVLTEKGVIAENTSKSNEVFTFKVGKHIFEGKVLKIKKTK